MFAGLHPVPSTAPQQLPATPLQPAQPSEWLQRLTPVGPFGAREPEQGRRFKFLAELVAAPSARVGLGAKWDVDQVAARRYARSKGGCF